MSKKKVLLCGATGFIGRNILESLIEKNVYEVHAVMHERKPPQHLLEDDRIQWHEADLREAADVERILAGKQILIQAAATTSGAKEIVSKPYFHVTDNAVMNSLLFRQCYEQKIERVIFFSCTTMYKSGETPVKEEDFDGQILDKYFGVGWTKVYVEKLCQFYAGLGPTKYMAIRHSNIYGPYDKYDLERSHVFGATVAKVMQADNEVVVWGDGSDERDLLHVNDLVNFVELAIEKQEQPFELLNLGLDESVSIKELVEKIIRISGRDLKMSFDTSQPSIGFKLRVDSTKARQAYGWKPAVSLDQGIKMCLDWYRENYKSEAV